MMNAAMARLLERTSAIEPVGDRDLPHNGNLLFSMPTAQPGEGHPRLSWPRSAWSAAAVAAGQAADRPPGHGSR